MMVMKVTIYLVVSYGCTVASDTVLPLSLQLSPGQCWGYEADCDWSSHLDLVTCDPSVTTGWNGDTDPRETFYKQADFGYIRNKLGSMKQYCSPLPEAVTPSKLTCSDNLEFCTASNIMIDFTKLKERVAKENLKYKMDIFSAGDIQLKDCSLNKKLLQSNLEFMSPLQSWSPELQHVVVTAAPLQCDITLDIPVVIMKLDAAVNMYHHFCDFFNLYLSQHMNFSLSNMDDNIWSDNKQILLLENIPSAKKSPFSVAFSSFSSNKLLDLNNVAGKKVCFKNVVFPFLSRMIFGLYYNTPLINGCHGSRMVQKFSQYMLETLGIKQDGVLDDGRLRVTIIARDTKYRRIVNEAELVSALQRTGHFKVTVARFTPHVPFQSQLSLTHNTDILVGLHGAGLTHLMFLPDWAEVLELYNCDDPNCYEGLARLRGVGYTTHDWSGESLMKTHMVPGGYQGPAHKKFSNYEFDPEEFTRLMLKIMDKVLSNSKFQSASSGIKDEF